MTGIPADQLSDDEKSRLLKMEAELHKSVIGQDEAIKKVTSGTPDTVEYMPIPIRSLYIGDKIHGGLEAPDSNAISWSFLPNYSDDLAIVAPTDFNPLTDLVPATT